MTKVVSELPDNTIGQAQIVSRVGHQIGETQ
jgi:hypothetical protein